MHPKPKHVSSIVKPDEQHTTLGMRVRHLPPLAAIIVATVIVMATGLFYFYSENMQNVILSKRMYRSYLAAQDFYKKSIQYDAQALRAVMHALKRNEKISEIFAENDREKLFEYIEPLFINMKADYNITHFYFTRSDRVNLLRVHAPERYNDKINRITTLQAEQSRAIAHGVELGTLGTFTLRLVSPLHNNKTGDLMGYIELGMEIDHVLKRLGDLLGFDIVVAVRKEFLKRKQWEDGMRALNRDPHWDRFDTVVLSMATAQDISPIFASQLQSGELIEGDKVVEIIEDGVSYRLLSIPLEDVSGRHIAQMALLKDVSEEIDLSQKTSLASGIVAMVIGGILVAFFYWQTGRISHRIDYDELTLKKMATQDELTGLYNRRFFNESLDNELIRSDRFKHPLSLLLIDVDFFKLVNDTHGHQAGDIILVELSRRLLSSAREVDLVCRYGGEEISVLLPETTINEAREIALRIKNNISDSSFDIGDGQQVGVTASIGVASYPTHAKSALSLIEAADHALYTAKYNGRDQVCVYDASAIKTA